MASLYDPFLLGEEIKSTLDIDRSPSLRIGREVSDDLQKEALKSLIQKFAPDWISLQFVCYGFHPKGFVYGWGNRLSTVAPKVPWQIMFHEVWLGERSGSSFKEKCVGKVQKFFVRDLVRKISPRVIHTSNSTYAQILLAIGMKAKVLDLIGGVPIPEIIDSEYGNGYLSERLGFDKNIERSEWWWTGIYGALHSSWPAEPLFFQLQQIARSLGKKVAFFHLGRSRGGEGLLNQLKSKYQTEDFRIVALGEKLEEEIPSLLRQFDFGIAATPWQIIGKSSTVATLLELGIPVIVNREEPYEVREETMQDNLLIRFDKNFEKEFLNRLKKRDPKSRQERISRQMIEDLSK